MKNSSIVTASALSVAASLGAAQASDLHQAVQANPHAVSLDQYGRPSVVDFKIPTVKEGESSAFLSLAENAIRGILDYNSGGCNQKCPGK